MYPTSDSLHLTVSGVVAHLLHDLESYVQLPKMEENEGRIFVYFWKLLKGQCAGIVYASEVVKVHYIM